MNHNEPLKSNSLGEYFVVWIYELVLLVTEANVFLAVIFDFPENTFHIKLFLDNSK